VAEPLCSEFPGLEITFYQVEIIGLSLGIALGTPSSRCLQPSRYVEMAKSGIHCMDKTKITRIHRYLGILEVVTIHEITDLEYSGRYNYTVEISF